VLPQEWPAELRGFLQSVDEPLRVPLRSHPGRLVARGPLPEAQEHRCWRPPQEQAQAQELVQQLEPEQAAALVPEPLGLVPQRRAQAREPGQVPQRPAREQAQGLRPPRALAELTAREELPGLWRWLADPHAAPRPAVVWELSQWWCPEGFAAASGEEPHGLLSGRGCRFRERLVWWRKQRRRRPARFSKSAYRRFTSNPGRMQHVNSASRFADTSPPHLGVCLHINIATSCTEKCEEIPQGPVTATKRDPRNRSAPIREPT
jgi:hypothetical protein